MPSFRLFAASVGLLVIATGGGLVAGRAAGPLESGAAGQPAAGLEQSGTQAGTVPGYPDRVVPVVPGTTALTTSVSPRGGRLKATLTGQLARDAGSVFRFYRARLTRLGFVEVDGPAVGDSTALVFTRGDSSVVVTATPGHITGYRVMAVLTRGRS